VATAVRSGRRQGCGSARYWRWPPSASEFGCSTQASQRC
jgi:hypothetical protein